MDFKRDRLRTAGVFLLPGTFCELIVCLLLKCLQNNWIVQKHKDRNLSTLYAWAEREFPEKACLTNGYKDPARAEGLPNNLTLGLFSLDLGFLNTEIGFQLCCSYALNRFESP